MNLVQIVTTVLLWVVFLQLFIVLNVYLYRVWREYKNHGAQEQASKRKTS